MTEENDKVVPVDAPPKDGDNIEEVFEANTITGKVISNPTEL